MKNKLKAFSVCHTGLIVGEFFKAKDITDLIENKLPKRCKNWECIGFVDEQDRNITVVRDFMETDKMTLKEVIEDWIEHGDIIEPVEALNPNNHTLHNGLTITLSQFGFTINK